MERADDELAVVVVTYNSAPVLPGLLDSLDAGVGDVDWHLIVADNDSSDDSLALVHALSPDATVVAMGRNAGYAAGVNAAVAASAPYTAILVLNPDVRLGAGCVSELLKALRRPGVGISVPHLLDARSKRINSMRREPTVGRAIGDALLGASRAGRYPRLGEVVTDNRPYAVETATDWAEGSTQLISAECWRRCGPWDERFFLYSEETDFDLRARDAGLVTMFVPTAEATHLEGGSTNPELWSLLTVNQVRLFRSRNGRLPTLAFWLAVMVRELRRAACGRRTSRAAVRALMNPKQLRHLRAAPSPR